MLVGLILAAFVAARNWEPTVADAAATGSVGERLGLGFDHGRRLEGDQLERWHTIFNNSRRYRISSELSAAIYDAAVAEHIDPALAYPLVHLESRFNERAVSSVGAIGLTQLMVPTARAFAPEVTRDDLFERDLNLAIGFRYLRELIRMYGNVQLALLVYNRGPEAVALDREIGIDPSNGYDRIVLKGYRGKGTTDD